MPLGVTYSADWLEWSGLPTALNELRQGGWSVFKKIVELDCRTNRRPDTVEITVGELSERVGFTVEKTEKIILALRKRKYLRCYLPDHAEEPALFEIRTPVRTPIAAEEVPARVSDPLLRDPSNYRYAWELEDAEPDIIKVQEVADLYMNHMSQKMNSFILEQIEITARRFELEKIRRTIERAARHEIRAMGWVLKELIREQKKADAKAK